MLLTSVSRTKRSWWMSSCPFKRTCCKDPEQLINLHRRCWMKPDSTRLTRLRSRWWLWSRPRLLSLQFSITLTELSKLLLSVMMWKWQSSTPTSQKTKNWRKSFGWRLLNTFSTTKARSKTRLRPHRSQALALKSQRSTKWMRHLTSWRTLSSRLMTCCLFSLQMRKFRTWRSICVSAWTTIT